MLAIFRKAISAAPVPGFVGRSARMSSLALRTGSTAEKLASYLAVATWLLLLGNVPSTVAPRIRVRCRDGDRRHNQFPTNATLDVIKADVRAGDDAGARGGSMQMPPCPIW